MVRHVRDPVTGRCIICDKNKIVHYMDSDDPHSEGATATWDDVRKKVTYINALTNPTRPASHHPVNPTPSDPETRSPTDSKTGNPSLQSTSLHSSPIPPSTTAAPDHSPSPDRNKSPIRVPETGPKYIESKPRGVIEVKQYQPPPSPPLPPRNIRQVYPNSPPPVYIVEQRPPVIPPRRQDSPIQVSESQPRQNGYSRIIDRYGTNHVSEDTFVFQPATQRHVLTKSKMRAMPVIEPCMKVEILRPQHNTIQHNTTQHNTTQHNTTQHNTTQHNTTQHNTNTTQLSTALHSTTQHSTTQYSTTQHNTI